MQNILPESFRELFSALLFVIGIIFSFISFNNKNSTHSLRLTGLFLLSALSLFANNAWCYFASVFIVATAVTQLEFLQNLAAIMRGSKEFFDYQKEFLSRKEIEEAVAKEVDEIDKSEAEEGEQHTEGGRDIHIVLDSTRLTLTPQQLALISEEYAFRYLERKYERPIQRHVRFRSKNTFIEFDGVMQMDDHDIIFEIKTSRRGFLPLNLIERSTERLIERVKSYQLLTGRNAILTMVFVGEFSERMRQRIYEYHKTLQDNYTDVTVNFEIYSFREIGLTDFDAEQSHAPDGGSAGRSTTAGDA